MTEPQPPSSLPPSSEQQNPQAQPSSESQQQPQPKKEPSPSAPPAAAEAAPTSTDPTTDPVTVKEEPDGPSAEALDASLEKEDIDMGGTATAGDNPAPQASGSSAVAGMDGAADGPAQVTPEINPVAPAPAPSKKDASLREFLGKMDEYAPIIPDAVTAHYLTLAGLPPPGNGPNSTPPHLARLLALATQKFVADIAADAYQYSRIRSSNSSSGNNPMGGLNVASGLAVPGQSTGVSGSQGAQGGSGEGSKGKSSSSGAHLGVQRPGYGGGGQGGSGQGRTVLTMEDLGMAVGEYGVSVKRGEFYR